MGIYITLPLLLLVNLVIYGPLIYHIFAKLSLPDTIADDIVIYSLLLLIDIVSIYLYISYIVEHSDEYTRLLY